MISAESTLSGNAIGSISIGTGPELEWNVISAGNITQFCHRVSGLVLDMNGGVGAQAGFRRSRAAKTKTARRQQWQIVPVH